MSQELINRSEDLKKLRNEGFELEIKAGFLQVHSVPYVNRNKDIKFGSLVTELTLAGERTTTPGTHVIHFVGEQPCDINGSEITAIKHAVGDQKLVDGLVINRSFSNKPAAGYVDYYDKVNRYVEIISAPAQSLDASVTAKTFKVIESDDEDSVFRYIDTNSSRAEIDPVTDGLKGCKLAIIGLGGTGSYALDLAAKTPAAEIHLFDQDEFLQHNAFRSPGAASLKELEGKPKKVEYLKAIYSKMHKGIVAHGYNLDAGNADQLEGFGFVFICIDDGAAKKDIIQKLESLGIPFVDVGMGVEIVDQRLLGIVRTTASVKNYRNHILEKGRISFVEGGDDDYSKNIQIADLNALNAALAVIKWKKIAGFYHDAEKEHHSIYILSENTILNDDNET